MNCVLCGGPLKGLGTVKIKDGQICKRCVAYLPSLMLENAKNLSSYTLNIAQSYVKTNRKKFCATASYGKLHIDEMHGLFAIAEKLDEDGKPKNSWNIFDSCDLVDIGIYNKNPRVDHNVVNIDVELKFELENPKCQIATVIKKAAHCKQKRIDESHVTWDDPGDLEIFKNMFNNMYKRKS